MPHAHSLKDGMRLIFIFDSELSTLVQKRLIASVATQHSALIAHYLEVYISLPIELM